MSGKTVNSAILLLVIGNAMALVSDVFIKLMESGAPIFQFTFLRCLLTLLMLLPLYRYIDSRRLFQGLGVHLLRAHVHLAGMVCMVIAIGSLPLATANAIFYAAPILVMLFAVIFFRERLSGFAGIIVILRPVAIGWGAVAALGAALALAIAAVMVRQLPRKQSTVHKLVLSYLLILPASFALMIIEGAPWDPAILVNSLGSTVFILGYNITVLLAYKQVDANQVTSAEYTGLIWAVAIGWIWFNEVPDLWFLVGSVMIVVPLVLIGLQHRKLRAATVRSGSAGLTQAAAHSTN
ncbi:DMT family transporter [Marinobacter changyiensis]|uniref:DMT family transporter n=1 Tax=Marinobacter changyiensis TaxID=2604091 RepID=UPI00126545F3|nr:DMT family transporter [Marinobacter changyiensis]